MLTIEDTSAALLQSAPEAVRRFCNLTYGITTHWGLYALIGRSEWAMHEERIPTPEYEQLARRFNPVRFDADVWIELVVEAGAQAFMITSKHHDGFCLYDTALTDYKITNTAFQRDPIAELANACHKRGVQLHFYYSILDWHHPAYRSVETWPEYVAYYQGQVRELCTKYGEIGGIVFDGYWPRDTYIGREYFVPAGAWDLAGTYDLIHKLQPNALVTNNHHVLPLKGEDYQVCELDLPGENTTGFGTTDVGRLPMATWFNINKGWSYRTEQELKPASQLIGYLETSAARNAFCWLNLGPTPEGEILATEAAELRQVGAWVRANEEKLRRQC